MFLSGGSSVPSIIWSTRGFDGVSENCKGQGVVWNCSHEGFLNSVLYLVIAFL